MKNELVERQTNATIATPYSKSSSKPQDSTPRILRLVSRSWAAICRWSFIAIPVGIVCGLATGAAVWFVLPPKYTASSVLRIKETRPYIAYESNDRSRAFVSTQLQLFGTRRVLDEALKQIGQSVPQALEKDDPIVWLQREITPRVISRSELVRVQFSDQDPAVAEHVLAAVVDSYVNYHQSYDQSLDRRVIQLLQGEKNRRKDALDTLRNRVRELSRQVAEVDGNNLPGNSEASPLRAIHDLLVKTEVDLEISKARLAAARDEVPATVSETELDRIVAMNPQLNQLNDQGKTLSGRLAQMDATLVDPTSLPRYQKIKADQAKVEQEIQSLKTEVRDTVRGQLLSALNIDREKRLKELESEHKQKETMQEFLRNRLKQETLSRSVQDGSNVDLEFARAELQRQVEVHDRIASRIVTIQTEQMAPAQVEILDRPVRPTVAEGARLEMAAASALAGFFLPFVVAIGYEQLSRRVTGREELVDDHVLLGEVASLPRYVPRLEAGTQGLTLFEESIDQLCNSIRLSREFNKVSSVAVVSAVSGEGKTHVATQLAISLARATNEPVLLLESDFRSPDFSQLLGVEDGPGLLNVLLGDAALEDSIQSTVDTGLHVLTAGVGKCDLHSVVNLEQIQSLFDQLHERYRFVVVDTPPILATGESLIFASHADATIMCVRRGYSRMAQVNAACERLRRINCNPIGSVLNGVTQRRYAHSYGKY